MFTIELKFSYRLGFMIHLMVTYKVKEDQVDEVKKAIIDFLAAVADNEPQTVHYASYQKADNDRSFIHCMCFENEEARHTHEKAEYTKQFTELLYSACEKEPVFTDLNMIKCNRHL